MDDQPRDPTTLTPGPDWTPAKPEHIPLPTFWPAALALGATLGAWGIITTWIISAFGVVLFIVAMAGWIADIRHERRIE